MGFFDKLRAEFVDIVEFLDNSNNTIIYRFERYKNEIKNGAKLIVREGQQAVFLNEGKIADVFNPGTYTLTTENLPILATLKGWKYGFNSPFKAEVYFLNTKTFIDQKWGTKTPIILNDSRFGMLEIRAFGTYTFKIIELEKFIREIVGTKGIFTTEDIDQQLKSLIVTRFTNAVGQINLPIENYAANLNDLSLNIFNFMQNDFLLYGIEVTKFLIENVSMPEDIKKEIFELSRLNVVDLNKLAQMKAAKAMEIAAANPSGAAGAGVGMGAGFAMANQMAQTFNNPSTPNAPLATPPPLGASISYFVAINNQQNGPFNEQQLQELVVKGDLKRDSLVWKQGLAAWDKAENQTELQSLWNNTPPNIPSL